ncbi:MAG: carboxyl transferase domain-containing protein [Thermoleophilia bacterium]
MLRHPTDLLREARRVGTVQTLRAVARPSACPRCAHALDLHGACEACGYARRLSAREWIDLLVEPRTFAPFGPALVADPIEFRHEASYPDQLAQARSTTGADESVQSGRALVGRRAVVVVAFDFAFLGGSLGVAAGERVVEALTTAAAEGVPAVMVVASSGARMQEGLPALFQMARTSAAAVELRRAGVPFVAILTDPTTGAPYASVANLADVVLAERGALVGFAGPRVVEAVTGEPAEGLRADELGERGILDAALARTELRPALATLLELLVRRPPLSEAGQRLALPLPQLPADRWALVQAIREPGWPSGRAWLDGLAERQFVLRGDRTGEDDPALVVALAEIAGERVLAIAQDRSGGTGLVGPAGYRKAIRGLRIAARLRLPVLTILDGPGAAVGAEADRQGIAVWLAESFAALLEQPTPVVSLVVGQGSSGGAIALAAGDRILMLERSIFSVIAPEGAAAIISRDPGRAPEWAEALRLSAADAQRLGLVDGVLPEPRSPVLSHALRVRRARVVLARAFAELRTQPAEELTARRRQRFLDATRPLARPAPQPAEEHPPATDRSEDIA